VTGRKTLTIIGILCALAALTLVWFLFKKRPPASAPASAPTPSLTTTRPNSDKPDNRTAPQPTSSADSPDVPEPTWGPTSEQLAAAQDAAAAMSDEQLAGQVIIAHWSGTDPATAVKVMGDFNLAGIILMGPNIADETQIKKVSDAVQNEQQEAGRNWPAIISVDQEGGRVARLRGVIDDVPAFAKLAAAGSDEITEALTRMGQQMSDLGFTMDFAPVADVSIGAQDPTIGDRSAGSDPDDVADAVTTAVAALRDGGVVPVIKHFPGHGSVTVDSHVDVPVQKRDLDELRAKDFKPFEAAINDGAPVVMMGHIALEALDAGVPATLSPPAYELLRDELEFEGVIVTDAMNMNAITQDTKAGEETVAALAAGADLVLMPPDTKAAHAAVLEALKSGDLDREKLEESAARVIALQMWAHD